MICYLLLSFIGKYIRFVTYDAYYFHPTATYILNYMNGDWIVKDTSDSFYKFARVYKYLNIFRLETFMQWEVYLTIVMNLILILILVKNKTILKEISLKKLLFLYLAIILLNTYVFGMGKEAALFLVFLVFYLVINSSKYGLNTVINKVYLIVLTFVYMGVAFKTYYFLTLAFFVALYWLFSFKMKKKYTLTKSLLFLFLFALVYIFMIIFVGKFFPQYYQKFVEVGIAEYDQANSMIAPFLKGNNYFILFINYIVKILRLLFPIELFRLGIKYVPYIVFQILISGYSIKCVQFYPTCSLQQKLSTCIFMAYLLTSASFEPDFGSWIRHEMVCFPLFLNITNLKK